jgi:hypothetical protein
MDKPPRIASIDFSEAHFLDHSLWHCRGLPGGRRRHLADRWRYQWSDVLRRHTTCRIGWHYYTNVFRKGQPVQVRCFYCWKGKP